MYLYNITMFYYTIVLIVKYMSLGSLYILYGLIIYVNGEWISQRTPQSETIDCKSLVRSKRMSM